MSLPRASGGVSLPFSAFFLVAMSSPRKRGCFRRAAPIPATASVFPAQAGVFLFTLYRVEDIISLPRASGGVSTLTRYWTPEQESSPRKRGCFQTLTTHYSISEVFPAQAGVFPSQYVFTMSLACLPRASGGVSISRSTRRSRSWSSPRKRGCFLHERGEIKCRRVFPAQAGVFQKRRERIVDIQGLPRASGGVSNALGYWLLGDPSSPRKRGCFHTSLCRSRPHLVFPAQAGVFPSATVGRP